VVAVAGVRVVEFGTNVPNAFVGTTRWGSLQSSPDFLDGLGREGQRREIKKGQRKKDSGYGGRNVTPSASTTNPAARSVTAETAKMLVQAMIAPGLHAVRCVLSVSCEKFSQRRMTQRACLIVRERRRDLNTPMQGCKVR